MEEVNNIMEESILKSTKKLLGIAEEHTHFDSDIIMYINTVFGILTQMGVGPKNGFVIHDDTATWDKYTDDQRYLEAVRTYMYHKVKLMFDPPLNSTVMECTNRIITELETRLFYSSEFKSLQY